MLVTRRGCCRGRCRSGRRRRCRRWNTSCYQVLAVDMNILVVGVKTGRMYVGMTMAAAMAATPSSVRTPQTKYGQMILNVELELIRAEKAHRYEQRRSVPWLRRFFQQHCLFDALHRRDPILTKGSKVALRTSYEC